MSNDSSHGNALHFRALLAAITVERHVLSLVVEPISDVVVSFIGIEVYPLVTVRIAQLARRASRPITGHYISPGLEPVYRKV